MVFSGSFQIYHAKAYMQKHLRPSILFPGQYEFTVQINGNNTDIFRIIYQPRHSNTAL